MGSQPVSINPGVSTGTQLRTGGAIKTSVKAGAAFLSERLGLDWLIWNSVLSDRLLILCYHSVIPDGGHPGRTLIDDSAVFVSEFKHQLEVVLSRYSPWSLQDLLGHIGAGRQIDRPRVLITFDDGFRNNYDYAAPVLKRLGVPAVFSVTTGYIGSSQILWPNELALRVFHWPARELPVPDANGSFRLMTLKADAPSRCAAAESIREMFKRLPNEAAFAYLKLLRSAKSGFDADIDPELHAFMSWNEVRGLANQGFEIASHTVSHPILTRISASEVDHELRQSKEQIEQKLGIECPCFVYPNGCENSYSSEIAAQCGRAGYRIALTLTNQFAALKRSRFALSRVYVPGQVPEASFRFRASSIYGTLRCFA